MQLSVENPQSSILTLHDAITDSPVYRSSSLHFDEQLDLLEKWLEMLSKYMKQYVEKLNKFNLETNTLCKKVIPVGIDDVMIDPNFTGGIIKSFSDALQTSLAFKTKLVSDLEDNFIQPLQLFVKNHLKEFKDFRKQHEKVLEKYDKTLQNYTAISKSKEASAVREEAFRLYEARKAYVRLSGQHVVRILHFRSLLEHFLVERFSLATGFHLQDSQGGSVAWSKLQSSLISWKQWLTEDKETCNYQLSQLQASRATLESKYLDAIRPARELEKYTTSNHTNSRHSLDLSATNQNSHSHKWGYLFVRGSRSYWTRRWFFLYDGCFGSININPSSKLKGTITMGENVSVLLCDIKLLSDVDRRFCFEVMCAHQPSFVLQAETEEEMREWVSVFEKSRRLMLQNEQLDFKNGTVITNNNTSTITETDSVTNSVNSPPSASLLTSASAASKSKPTIMVDEAPALVVNNNTSNTSVAATTDVSSIMTTHENNNSSVSVNDQHKRPSIVMLSTTPENDQQSLSTSTSLTPLLVWEASRIASGASNSSSGKNGSIPASSQASSAATLSLDAALKNDEENTASANTVTASVQVDTTSANNNSSSWGIPWALVPSMFQGSASSDDAGSNELPPTPGVNTTNPAVTDTDGHQVVWPIRVDDSQVPKADLTGYPATLDARNRELRHLFGGVGPQEVVLSTFIGLLKKKPLSESGGGDSDKENMIDRPTSPTIPTNIVDNLEQELNSLMPNGIRDPKSDYGYAYTGRGYVTQDTFWFYSCILMTCVNTIAIRLKDIKSIRVIRDSSIPNLGISSNLALEIDLVSSSGFNDAQSPLIFTTLMDDIETVAERLKFAVENAKSKSPESLQMTYDIIHNLSASTANNHKKQSQVKTIAVANPPIELPIRSNSDITKSSLLDVAVPVTPIPSRSTETGLSSNGKKKPAITTAYNNSSTGHRKYSAPVQPKSGALAAAMMAATVAGGSGFLDARKELQEGGASRNTKTKADSQRNEDSDGETPLPLPASKPSIENLPKVSKKDKEGETKTIDPNDVPDDFKIPSGPVSCNCEDHLDKLEAEIEVPVNAKHLFTILFSEDNPKYQDIWEKKTLENKSKNLSMTQWNKNGDEKAERTLQYIIPVNNAMVKLKEAEVVEKQIIERKENFLRYVVLTTTKTAQLPYADAFVPYVKYCITWVSKDRCKLACFTGVKFLKNILVKGIVSKAAMKGMAENIAIFMPIIKAEATKQRKRSGSSSSSKSETVSLKRSATIKRPNMANVEEEAGTKGVAGEKDEGGWLDEAKAIVDMIRDLVEGLPFTFKAGAGVIVLLWIMWSWLRAGSRGEIKNKPVMNVQYPQAVSRAVYLRDINEGLLNADVKPSYTHSDSFRLFLESKSTNRTLGTNRHWFSYQHHQFAIDLLFSRERLAMLRHDTLILFQLMNEVDAQLFENEYTNWLMDTRLECKDPEANYKELNCDDIKRQLKYFTIGSSFSESNGNKLKQTIKNK